VLSLVRAVKRKRAVIESITLKAISEERCHSSGQHACIAETSHRRLRFGGGGELLVLPTSSADLKSAFPRDSYNILVPLRTSSVHLFRVIHHMTHSWATEFQRNGGLSHFLSPEPFI
jgi:hypothetical protein